MPVTELAILKLRANYDPLEFLEVLMEVQELQDNWIRENQPYNLESGATLSSMYTQVADVSSLLITAPWDSSEAHGEWIQSKDNQIANGKLSQFIAPGCHSVILFHMEPAGRRPQMREAFSHNDDNGGLDACRLTVNPDKREALQGKYQALEYELRKKGLDKSIWAGWRIEKSGSEEDLVVFWCDDVPQDRLKELMSLADKTDHRRFQHVV